jgi:DnaJ-class molecular chaperone
MRSVNLADWTLFSVLLAWNVGSLVWGLFMTGTRLIECPACSGTGFETLEVKIPCAACYSTGILLGNNCPECGGKGNLNTDSKVICEVCKGTGQVTLIRDIDCSRRVP